MKILIGTPAYGDSVTTTYCESLFWLFDHFRARHPHIALEHKFLSVALLPAMRNYFASCVLNDPSYTHLLFIDSDMGFAPTLIEHMIAAEKPVVGCIYPKRKMDLAQIDALRSEIDNVQVARLVAQDYVAAGTSIYFDGVPVQAGDPVPMDKISVDGPAIRVNHAGTGVMLIRREVFARLKLRFPELWAEKTGMYGHMGLSGGVLQCFETMADENGLFVGEDIAFCRRWVEGCGGEIWSVVTETIVHVGTEKYVGRFLTKLQHGRA
jgi:hypothetical protein